MAFCKNCGATVPDGNKYCPECGQPVEVAAQPQQGGAPVYGGQPDYQRYEQQYNQQYQSYNQQDPNYNQQYNQQYNQNYNQQYQNYQPRPAEPASIGVVYSRSFGMLSKKPILLWGLSLMSTLLTTLASIFGVLPIISLPIKFALEVGMASVYLDAVRGKKVNSDQLFSGFKTFFRVAGGMGWMYLWILIWALVPIAGIVLAIIKMYSYRFVPYILINDPDISATEALRVSMRMTSGFKARMFGADVLIGAIVAVAFIIFGLLCKLGAFFILLMLIVVLVVIAFLPLVQGTISATFYDEIEKIKR